MLRGLTTLHRDGNILAARYTLENCGGELVGWMTIDAPVVLSTFLPHSPDDTIIAHLATGERFRFVVTEVNDGDTLRVRGSVVA